MKEIMAQSKEMMLNPKPLLAPKSALIVTFVGANQHTQLKMLSAVKR
jgi:hypothetical protein